jgi:hypothetical protein
VAQFSGGISDTELSVNPITPHTYDGKTYWGYTAQEHKPTATREEKLKNLYMSLDNIEVLFSPDSLCSIFSSR